MLSQTLSPSSFPVVVRSHLVVTLLLHCVWSTSESPVIFARKTRGKSTFGEKVSPQTLNVSYATSPQMLKDSDGTSRHTLNVNYATSQQTLKASNGTSQQTFSASYGTSPQMCNTNCFTAEVGIKTNKLVHRNKPDTETMSAGETEKVTQVGLPLKSHNAMGETEKVTQVPLKSNNAMAISADLMFERINRSYFSQQIFSISKTTSPEKSTKSTVAEKMTSEETLTTPGNVSVAHRETSKEAIATEKKELVDILGKSDTQPLTSMGVFGDSALDCMKRNGTLHFKIRKHSSVLISFQVDKRHVGSGQNMFCVIRWHFIGNVGTFFQIWQKDCKKSEDSASVYELNSTLPHYPQMRHLFGICKGSRLKHYYGQTNEMLVFIKTKDAHPFMLFLLEINSRSLESLETRFLSGQEGTNVILARL